jgi:hypothetical protein
MTLQKTLESLATEFARNVLSALRSASFSDLTESIGATSIPIKRRGGGVEHVARDVLALTGLLSTRAGLRAEQIRAQLRWDKKKTTKAIMKALDEKRVTKRGQKTASTYYLAAAA